MTVETMDARRGPAGQPPRDRRAGIGNRVQFEALVEVGAGATGGFEAESVDVSPEGMRLRTAYLPEPGERLVCRFDGFGGEVVAEGQVIWCADQGRGGEFGVRFTRLDERAIELLRDMCVAEEPEDDAAEGARVSPGARVRLHIQGLGSPMRARVRDATAGEVLIGSNLEFLRVGRDVQLEDVDGGQTQVAQIEHVDVSVDPETNIPQLIVALRYEGQYDDPEIEPPDETTAPVRVARHAVAPAAPAEVVAETTPEPTVIDGYDETEAIPPSDGVMAAPEAPELPPSDAPGAVDVDAEGGYVASPSDDEPPARRRGSRRERGAPRCDDDGSGGETKTAQAAARLAGAKAKLGSTVEKVGPVVARVGSAFGSAAKGTSAALGRVLRRVKERREAARAEKKGAKPAGPMRTTAPPPSGALRSDGRRLFRSKETVAETEAAPRKPTDRKRTAFGIVLGLLAVAAIYGVAHKVSAWRAESGSPPALSRPAELGAVDPAAEAPAPLDPGQGAVASAAVPLFGATPLSTTEPVPVPSGLDEAMAADDDGAGTDAPAAEADSKPLTLDKEWGVGSVESPTVLRIKMDGAIDGISGAEGATGFTIVVPNRKSVSSAAGLARKDKRIESVNVVNFPDRCEVTVHFKRDVPAFLARIKDKALIIEVGAEEKGSKAGDDHEVSSGSKKSGKKAKASSSKSSTKKSGASKQSSKSGKSSKSSKKSSKDKDKK